MEDKVLNRQFGLRLKFLRELENITQSRLAEVIGVSEQYIGMIERGVASPSFKLMGKLARALQTEPANLFLFSSLQGEGRAKGKAKTPKNFDWSRFVTHIGVWKVELKTGKHKWSDSLYQLLGVSPKDVAPSQEAFLSFVHRDDREAATEHFEQLASGVQVSASPMRLIRPDGAVRHVVCHAETEFSAKGKPLRLSGALLDVTERKRLERSVQAMQGRMAERVRERTEGLNKAVQQLEAEVEERKRVEEELQRNERWMSSFMHHARSAIAVKTLEGRYVLVNHAFSRLAGLTPDDLFGKTAQETLPNGMAEIFTRWDLHLQYSADARESEERLLVGGEDRVFLVTGFPLRDANGVAMALGYFATDITDRTRSEEASRQYQFIADASHDYMTMIDGDYRYTAANAAYCAAIGLDREQVVGKAVEDIWGHDIFHEVIRGSIDTALAGNEVQYEVWMDFPERGRGCFDVSYYPFSPAGGEPFAVAVVTRDVTERRMAEDGLRKNRDMLSVTQEMARVGGWELDLNKTVGEIMVFSVELLRILQGDESLEPGLETLVELCHEEDRPRFESVLAEARLRGSPFDVELRMLGPDGEYMWVRALGRARLEGGKPDKIVGAIQDITDRKKTEARLQELATTDGLTGVWNRQYFMDLAQKEFSRAARYGRPVALLYMDADGFKSVNDLFGHQAGDTVLRAFGDVTREVLRDVDLVGRVGGEEFAVLLPETDKRGAMQVAERLRKQAAAAKLDSPRGKVSFTISIGAASTMDGASTLEDLFSQADAALYHAKNKGRNRVELYSP